MKIPLYQVDAFTDQAFHGNPAGVCCLSAPRPNQWMQCVAQEMNLSETAFLLEENDGYRLRWFTPAVEVDLCGHATLASAHILWETGRLGRDKTAKFYSRSGLLSASFENNYIQLNFPVKRLELVTIPEELSTLLGVRPVFVGKNQFDYLVEVESEEILRSLQPDMTRLSQIPVRGVIVTCAATTPGYDFISRFFAPRVGVPEDPVTGSAHCCLTPYWSEKLHKQSMLAFQASSRGGELRLRLQDDRVLISGQAVTVFQGELNA
jgi:PhzF family phenazine biosynthesis protein